MSSIRAFFLVSRYEFMLGGAFFLLSISAIASGNFVRLGENTFLIVCGILVWYLSHMIGGQVNCLMDYEFDKVHKVHLAKSVDGLGRQKIWAFIWGESLLAFLCALYMSWLTGKPILVILWITGWVVAMGYSLEPLHFKRRGLLNPFSLLLVLYILPIMFGYLALKSEIDFLEVMLLVSIGFQMLCLIFLNEIEDVPEDSMHNIETPSVYYGLWPLVPFSMALFLIGTIMTLAFFYKLINLDNTKKIFLVLGISGNLLILRDLISMTIVSWKNRNVDNLQGQSLQILRRLGKRNAIHFGILGLIISIGSLLTLY